MLFQVVYKHHCIDNIGASISLVYTTCSAKKLAEHIANISQAIVPFYTQMTCYIIFHCC